MKRLKMVIMAIMFLVIASVVNAEVFVNDDGTQLTVSWSEVSSTFYYEVNVENLTMPSTVAIIKHVFDPYVTVSGLIYHNIYRVTVMAYSYNGNDATGVGEKYITFAVEKSSETCICNCNCPEIPKKIFYGISSEQWCTGIAINNSSDALQCVSLKIGAYNKQIVVPSNSTEIRLLSDLIGESDVMIPISLEADSAEIGITVVTYNSASCDYTIQN